MIGVSASKEAAKRAIKNRFNPSKLPSVVAADYEVLVIGAGIAGIGMGCYLQQQKT